MKELNDKALSPQSTEIEILKNSIRKIPEQVSKAMKVLVKVLANKTANDPPYAMSQRHLVDLIFHLSHPVEGPVQPFAITLPHPIFDENSEVCVFTLGEQVEAKTLFQGKKNVEGLGKIRVISFDRLKAAYDQPLQKRELQNNYELFLCDSRLPEELRRFFGFRFWGKGKTPIPIELEYTEDPTKEISRVARGTSAAPGNRDRTVTVTIGNLGTGVEELIANAKTVIPAVTAHFGKFEDGKYEVTCIEAQAIMTVPIWRRPDFVYAGSEIVQSNISAIEPRDNSMTYFIPGVFAVASFTLVLIGLKKFSNFQKPVQRWEGLGCNSSR